MSDSPPQKTITRQELYDQVWETPVSRLCRQYGVYDAILRKLCRKHRIPLPDVSYWSRKRLGQPVQRTPLPACDDEALQNITIEKPCSPPVSSAPAAPPPSPVYDADIIDRLDLARKLDHIQVAETLPKNPHKLVASTRSVLRESRPDNCNLLCPSSDKDLFINVVVSKAQVTRALCVIDALIKAIEKVGGKITVEKEHWSAKALLSFGADERMPIRLRESYRITYLPSEHPNWPRTQQSTPNGRLVLYVRDREFFREAEPGHIEESLNTIVSLLIEEAGRTRIRQRELAEEQRKHDDIERRKRELGERKRQEQERIKALRQEAAAWNESEIIRAYLKAVRTRYPGMEEGGELHQWLAWASEQADRLDPLTDSPRSVLDEPMPLHWWEESR